MTLHFSLREFPSRQKKAFGARRVDGLLIFHKVRIYDVRGLETLGFCFFQSLYLSSYDPLLFLAHVPDLKQTLNTSVIQNIGVRVDGHIVNQTDRLLNASTSSGCFGNLIGIEYDAFGLDVKADPSPTRRAMGSTNWMIPRTWFPASA